MKQILEKNNIRISRTAFLITQKCTLKCKLCLAFMPYYASPKHYSLESLKKSIKNYFHVVDFVHIFTISGGEPCMHKDLLKIYKTLFNYETQFNEVNMVINNTIKLSDDLLDFFENNKEKIKIILSDYGVELSTHFSYNKEQLERRDINYRVSTFHGEQLYYDGWIDFSDHKKKWHSIEARDKNASQCMQRQGRYFLMAEGELHCCGRGFWRSSQHIIPKVKGEYVAIDCESMSIHEKRADLINMAQLSSSTSCERCVGITNKALRHKPAEQCI